MTHFRLDNVSLKYQRLSPSGCKDKSIVKSEFVAKTQFLSLEITRRVPLKTLLYKTFLGGVT